MTDRITIKDLEAVVRRINRTLNGEELEPYTRDDDGTFHANIGAYCLDGAYGGWELHRIVNEGGGVSNVLHCGHVSKRELYDAMQAFLRGVDAQIEVANSYAAEVSAEVES